MPRGGLDCIDIELVIFLDLGVDRISWIIAVLVRLVFQLRDFLLSFVNVVYDLGFGLYDPLGRIFVPSVGRNQPVLLIAAVTLPAAGFFVGGTSAFARPDTAIESRRPILLPLLQSVKSQLPHPFTVLVRRVKQLALIAGRPPPRLRQLLDILPSGLVYRHQLTSTALHAPRTTPLA
jgi:hypothetical protein